MRRHHMPDIKEGGVNVTPLIDIVMVLIIFFMLVAKIGVSRGADENIALPSTILGKKIDTFSDTLTLNIHWNKSGDEPLLNTMIDNQKKELHITSHGASDEVLETVLQVFQKHFGDKASLIIRADRDLPYHQLEVVLTDAAKAGIAHVNYETKQGGDTPDREQSASMQ